MIVEQYINYSSHLAVSSHCMNYAVLCEHHVFQDKAFAKEYAANVVKRLGHLKLLECDIQVPPPSENTSLDVFQQIEEESTLYDFPMETTWDEVDDEIKERLKAECDLFGVEWILERIQALKEKYVLSEDLPQPRWIHESGCCW